MKQILRRERGRWLKELAAAHATSWRIATLSPSLDGLTRIETKSQSLYFQDGVCVRAHSRTGDTSVGCPLKGMRLVGWLTEDDRLLADYVDGARAVLFRTKEGAMTVALTGCAEEFAPVLPLTALTRPIPVVSSYAVI